jgi:hypothetical protein
MVHSSLIPAAIIGAGPYGISVAAHLTARGVAYRLFGPPLERWRTQMPRRMFLKSEGCASSLADPLGVHTLARYCARANLPYGDYGEPVARDTFVRYADAFQRELVPAVESLRVVALDHEGGVFDLVLADGQRVRAAKVILATGLSHASYLPPELARLPAVLRSHSEEHFEFDRFAGQDVTVVGAGQSALETAALLDEAGANVRLLVRGSALAWNPRPELLQRPWHARLRHPRSGLGQGLGMWFYSNAPMLFYGLPDRVRAARVRTVLGPAGAWWLRDRILGRVPVLLDHAVRTAEERNGRAVLQVQCPEGRIVTLPTDHVIAATGYRYDVRSLPFLSERAAAAILSVDGWPALSTDFESSVSGLYFTGLASARHFGPVMRFLVGAGYTARRVAAHVAGRQPHPRTRPVASAAARSVQLELRTDPE